MFFLDLRWLGFGLLLILVVIVWLSLWLGRRSRRWQEGLLFPVEVQTVLERAPFGLLVLSGQGVYSYVNPYACQLLGLEAPTGQLPDEEWVDTLNQDCATAREEAMTSGRYRSVALSAERFIRWWVTTWRDADGTSPVNAVFLLDVSAQQRAEQSARYLLSDLSHELRTPVATVLTHLEVLRLPNISEEIRRQSIHLMQVEARRMSRMTTALLELSRLETSGEIERRPVALLSLVEEATTQMVLQAQEKEIAISLEADTPLELVVWDAGRLKQVFLNLLDNAIKYSRPGDRTIVSLRQHKDEIACAVCDNGPGIPARHLPYVTKRFYRGVPEGSGGSGLGLALVEEILRRHQSRLEIESRAHGDQTGTCMRFALGCLSPTSSISIEGPQDTQWGGRV